MCLISNMWVLDLPIRFTAENLKIFGLIEAYRGYRATKLRDLLVASCIFRVFYSIFGVYIFPKWLKKVPGHFGILFRWFWELPKSWLFLDLLLVISGPIDLVFVVFLTPNYFKKYYFSMSDKQKFRKFPKGKPTIFLNLFFGYWPNNGLINIINC